MHNLFKYPSNLNEGEELRIQFGSKSYYSVVPTEKMDFDGLMHIPNGRRVREEILTAYYFIP